LVSSVSEFSRYVRKYVQNYPAADWPDESWDGVGEIWFDDLADMTSAFRERRYLEIIRPDEIVIARLDSVAALLLVDSPVQSLNVRSPHKLFRFLKQKKDSGGLFSQEWEDDCRRIFNRLPDVERYVSQYIQSYLLTNDEGIAINPWVDLPFPCDGIATFFFRNANDMNSFRVDPEISKAWQEMAVIHTDPLQSFEFPTWENVLIDQLVKET
jgi:hypothetical protein